MRTNPKELNEKELNFYLPGQPNDPTSAMREGAFDAALLGGVEAKVNDTALNIVNNLPRAKQIKHLPCERVVRLRGGAAGASQRCGGTIKSTYLISRTKSYDERSGLTSYKSNKELSVWEGASLRVLKCSQCYGALMDVDNVPRLMWNTATDGWEMERLWNGFSPAYLAYIEHVEGEAQASAAADDANDSGEKRERDVDDGDAPRTKKARSLD